MTLVDTDETIPKQAKQAIHRLHDHCNDLNEGIETFEAEIVAHARTMTPPAVWRRSPVSVRSPRR